MTSPEPARVPVLVLVGPPGAGTSTVGAEIAARRGALAIDTERRAARELGFDDVAAAFVGVGEDVFAERERVCALAALEEAAQENGAVVVLGASVTDARVRERLRPAVVIQLTASLAHAAPRLGFATARPVFLGNPRALWSRLVQERQTHYDAASRASVDTDDRTIAEVADAVEAALEEIA
ncbi:shikimate kinase [Litorihabitans aurantiacus]|uniref:Shikimate kinase n=1 Tax=Litorihabitans aurantiacus TaxID=1930061 RepID=A0AA37UUG8_9MICO|nr:shikimate kinase [Litorihabitans aurantiacus]GMA31355.1 shikimate kinase [Litorihabitans aurantiacus]